MINNTIKTAAVLLLLSMLGACEPSPSSNNTEQITFTDIEGREWSPSDWQGKWLVVNYWAIWCEPCRKEIPELNVFSEQHKESVKVIAINYDGVQGKELKQQITQLDIGFTAMVGHHLTDYYQLPLGNVLPVTFLIDPSGKLSHTLIGLQTAESIANHLAIEE